VESSSETLRHTQVSGTETRPVNPAQNTDHELIYQRAAVSQPSMQNDVSMAPISIRAQYTADPRSQSNGTLQQGTNLEFSGDSRGLMGMGVVQPVPDPREAARRTLNMYFRYSWPLLGHISSITPMNIIKADVHTCMLEIAAIFGCVTVN
jgi:hypothetical protein